VSDTEVDIPRVRAARQAREFGFPKRQTEEIEWRRVKLTPDQREAQQQLASIARAGGLAYLYGRNGVGKTLIVSGLGIGWEKVRHENRDATGVAGMNAARYWRAAELCGDLIRWQQSEATDKGSSPDDLARRAGLLVLDEIGDLKWTDFQSTTLSNIIDDRYTEKRATILIGNQKPNQLAKIGCPLSILDRTRDGGAIIDASGWKNMRGVA